MKVNPIPSLKIILIIQSELDPDLLSTQTLISHLAMSLSFNDLPIFDTIVVGNALPEKKKLNNLLDESTSDYISNREHIIHKYFICADCGKAKKLHRGICEAQKVKMVNSQNFENFFFLLSKLFSKLFS